MPDWWALGQPPAVHNRSEIVTGDVADVNITSEKISTNALRRSISCPLPDQAAGSTGFFTSAYQLWTPSVPIRIQAARLCPLTSWIQTTLQSTVIGTLYACDQTVGTVVIPTTNAPVRGSQLAFSIASPISIAANVPVTFGMPTATSAGMDAPALAVQIDYDSTA